MRTINQLLIFVLLCTSATAQLSSVKVTYERKTNLYKKWKREANIERWIKEEDKIKIDFFELYVTDTCSVFKPQETDIRDQYSWATTRNTVYQDYAKKTRYFIKPMWGEDVHISDTMPTRQWHITEGTRKIAGYQCRKAIWRANDSTRIYAWFSYDIVPSTGPESFNGLPGTILGIAAEDGAIVYFAKKVEIMKHEPKSLIPDRPKKKKLYTFAELRTMLTERYGHEKWFKNVLEVHFGVW